MAYVLGWVPASAGMTTKYTADFFNRLLNQDTRITEPFKLFGLKPSRHFFIITPSR